MCVCACVCASHLFPPSVTQHKHVTSNVSISTRCVVALLFTYGFPACFALSSSRPSFLCSSVLWSGSGEVIVKWLPLCSLLLFLNMALAARAAIRQTHTIPLKCLAAVMGRRAANADILPPPPASSVEPRRSGCAWVLRSRLLRWIGGKAYLHL